MATPIADLESKVNPQSGSTLNDLVDTLRDNLLDNGTVMVFSKYSLLQNLNQALGSSSILTDTEVISAAFLLITGSSIPVASYDGTDLDVKLNLARLVADDTGIDQSTGADVDFKYPNTNYLALLKSDAPPIVGRYMKATSGGQVNITAAVYSSDNLLDSSSYKVRELIDDLGTTFAFAEKEISAILFKSNDPYSAAMEFLVLKIKDLDTEEEASTTQSKVKIDVIEIDSGIAFESKSQKITRYRDMILHIRNLRDSTLNYAAMTAYEKGKAYLNPYDVSRGITPKNTYNQ